MLSCGEGPELSAKNGGCIKNVRHGAGYCALAAQEFERRFLLNCEDFLCFRDVGAEDGDDLAAVDEDAVSVTKCSVIQYGVKTELQESGDGKLSELHFGMPRDV